jgi:hypothetical protein
MAAVTVNRARRLVMGNRRVITANIDIAADADTYITGLTIIESVQCSSPTNNGIGHTVSGGTITFQTGGAEAAAHLHVVGW